MTLPKLTLVLGGAASGKSVVAEKLVTDTGLTRVYFATAQVFDDEMAAKVVTHREQRGPGWITVEEPIDLPRYLARAETSQAILIDCATLWLTNVLLAERDIDAAQVDLLTALITCPAPVVIVSNEVGQGIVPDNALSRQFRGAQGRLNQALAAQADLVIGVMAGLPMQLKGSHPLFRTGSDE